MATVHAFRHVHARMYYQQSNKQMANWNLLFNGGRCVAALGGLTYVFERFQPTPVAYGVAHCKTVDPSAEIKFGNGGGLGAMFVYSMLVKDKTGKTVSPTDAFGPRSTDRFVLSTVSENLFRDYGKFPRAWSNTGLRPLVCVRPRKEEDAVDHKFGDDFFAKLREEGLYIEVKTACSDMAPLSWFKQTRKLLHTPTENVLPIPKPMKTK